MAFFYSAVAFCRGRSTMSRATYKAQKRRSGLTDLVRPTPVGSIFAHEAIVVGRLRAFFRAANRRPVPARSDRAVYHPHGTCCRRRLLRIGPQLQLRRFIAFMAGKLDQLEPWRLVPP